MVLHLEGKEIFYGTPGEYRESYCGKRFVK